MPRYGQKAHLLRIVTEKLFIPEYSMPLYTPNSHLHRIVPEKQRHDAAKLHHATIRPESTFTPYRDRKAIHSGVFHATIHPKLPFTPYHDRKATSRCHEVMSRQRSDIIMPRYGQKAHLLRIVTDYTYIKEEDFSAGLW